jgi:predicted NAD/FAD-binding protein
LNVAVIGTGISGMAAAWLLSQHHTVTVYESDARIGGHTNTVDASIGSNTVPVDTGFIVYNPLNYPNLTALFAHLGVPTKSSDMSFAASLDAGRLEYSGSDLGGLFAQKRNLLRPRFWSMLRDLRRFYRDAPQAAYGDPSITLGDYLKRGGYGEAFCQDHLLPMAAAIWSSPPQAILDYPAAAFIRFHANHGLLQVSNRPEWRTVDGGSRAYVKLLTAHYAGRIKLSCGATAIRRERHGVRIADAQGGEAQFDHTVIATHADQALALLNDATESERTILSPFRYTRNLAVLHTDAGLMPKRRKAWASWNFIGSPDRNSGPEICVTYWMNRLQSIGGQTNLFVTLNPVRPPQAETVLHTEVYEHPLFDADALRAQARLWSLQGRGNTWFCGAYFGSGFHEDGLQAGLAVAEALGGVKRPWTVANESGRIQIAAPPASRIAEAA